MSTRKQKADTFRQPFLDKVKNAVSGAVSISWDGCHKICIALDQESDDEQVSFGYETHRITDHDAAIAELYEWFENSCGLRFINAVSSGPTFHDVIPQFEYDDVE